MSIDTLIILILTISNLVEIAYLIKSSKKTEENIDRAINDPEFIGEAVKNAMVGLAHGLRTDEEARAEFYALFVLAGQAAFSKTSEITAKEIEKVAKKNLPKMPKDLEWATPFIQYLMPNQPAPEAVQAAKPIVEGANF